MTDRAGAKSSRGENTVGRIAYRAVLTVQESAQVVITIADIQESALDTFSSRERASADLPFTSLQQIAMAAR